MAKWKCPRCSTNNDETVLRCADCGLIRGGVVVPGSRPPSEPTAWPGRVEPPAPDVAPDLGSPDRVTGEVGADRATDPVAAPAADSAVPGWPQPSLEAPPPTPLWRRLPWGWALTFVLVAGGAIGSLIFNAGRSGTGEIDRPGDLTVADLRVGDCFDLKDPTADEVEQVAARPCAEAHQYEMFFIGPHPDGTFPDDEAFMTFVEGTCLPAFEAYVGRAFADSVLDINWLVPTSSGWTFGDRTVQCAVYDPATDRLTASLKGSRR